MPVLSDLNLALNTLNIAELLDQETLDTIGSDLKGLIEDDEQSRSDWLEQNEEGLKLALQVKEYKSFPWPNASNVKYPLITIASMQFHARALPNLVNGNMPVRVRTIGRDDEQQTKTRRAQRISKYMSYQVLEEMEEWIDEFDRLLLILPMIGLCYKKTYYDPILNRNKSELCLPQEVIVNYHAKSYDNARMTHILPLDKNELFTKVRGGLYLDIDLGEPVAVRHRDSEDESIGLDHPSANNQDPYVFYECHYRLDLDEDGYEEPYIITLHADTGKVVRIVANWDSDKVFTNEASEVIKVDPVSYFTPFIFIPDPNSATYGIGFNRLLGPTNEAINTLLNQLIDAGTLSNLQGGFLARGVRVKGGALRFKPGEWLTVNTTGDDLRKGVFPMPIREPSNVLFQLLGLLIDSGQKVSAVSDNMVGENPGQNQPATTTMAILEQGLMVFTSIYKRIHRALAKEYKKIYRLNSLYLDEDKYNMVLDEQEEVSKEDFLEDSYDVSPASDPNIVSKAQKSIKAQSLIEKLAMGLPINPVIATRQALIAEEHENIDEIMNVQPPGPSPEQELAEAEFIHKSEYDWAVHQLDNIKVRAQAIKDMSGAELNASKIESAEQQAIFDELRLILEAAKAQDDAITNRIKALKQGEKKNDNTARPESR